MVDEGAGQGDRLGLFVCHLLDGAAGLDLQDPCAGHGQQDRRMRGHHELAPLLEKFPDPDHHRQASLHRQGCLGSVQYVQAVRAETAVRQVQERLAVGAFVQGPAAVGAQHFPRAFVTPLAVRARTAVPLVGRALEGEAGGR
ncbi:hypothetical protein [Streptomyces sp. NPDC001296]